ncbi:MAG: HEAT repeat domain-containing protein [Verrucomicrobiota bacterium]|jgi:HEAT repeat protein
MRPKIVILILLAALAGVTGILLIKHRGSPPPAAAPIAITETKPAAPQTAPTIANVPPPAPVAAAPVATLTPEQRQAAIDAETDRLQQWSMNDDPESLSNILADLTNPEKEVRKAAIEAADQFGSTNAIPILKNLAANNEDPEEKAALLEAANFLSLPSIFDTGTSTTPAEREARRQARMQNHAPNQNPPAAPNN